MTRKELILAFPNASQSFLQANATKTNSPVQNPVPKQDHAPTLGSPVQRKKAGLGLAIGRIEVRFTLFRVRCLDPDNAAASTKNLLDGLRHSGILPEDNPWTIRLQVEQEKVKSFDQEKTEIEINYPLDYWEIIK
jgi:hypothetical protein